MKESLKTFLKYQIRVIGIYFILTNVPRLFSSSYEDISVSEIKLDDEINNHDEIIKLIEKNKFDFILEKKVESNNLYILHLINKVGSSALKEDINIDEIILKIEKNSNAYAKVKNDKISFFYENENAKNTLKSIIEYYMNIFSFTKGDLNNLKNLKIVKEENESSDTIASYVSHLNIIILNEVNNLNWNELKEVEKFILTHEFSHLFEKSTAQVKILDASIDEAIANTAGFYNVNNPSFINYTYHDETLVENNLCLLAITNRVSLNKYLEAFYQNDLIKYYNNLGYTESLELDAINKHLNVYTMILNTYEKYDQSIYTEEEKEEMYDYVSYNVSLQSFENLISNFENYSLEENITLFHLIDRTYNLNKILFPNAKENEVIKLNYNLVKEEIKKTLMDYYDIDEKIFNETFDESIIKDYGYDKILYTQQNQKNRMRK